MWIKDVINKVIDKISAINSEKDGTPSWIRWVPSTIIFVILAEYGIAKHYNHEHDFGNGEIIVIGLCITGKVVAKKKGFGETAPDDLKIEKDTKDETVDDKNS